MGELMKLSSMDNNRLDHIIDWWISDYNETGKDTNYLYIMMLIKEKLKRNEKEYD